MAFYSETLALPDNAFSILRDLIMERTGIYYEDSRKDMLADKLSNRVLECGFNSFLDYYYLLKYDNNESEWDKVIDQITIKETYFWREHEHLEILNSVIIPEFFNANPGKVCRIWCAACSTGEEPLSILMALDHSGWLGKERFEILATDISRDALEKARKGLYRERSLRMLPPEMRERYFSQEDNMWRIDPEIQRMIRWKTLNLLDDGESSLVPVQNIIFCRNVFIYFKEPAIKKVTESFFMKLTTPGFLFIGITESLFRITGIFELAELGKTFIYKKK
jgi:chemotaxis protein methyltransferase CheR